MRTAILLKNNRRRHTKWWKFYGLLSLHLPFSFCPYICCLCGSISSTEVRKVWRQLFLSTIFRWIISKHLSLPWDFSLCQLHRRIIRWFASYRWSCYTATAPATQSYTTFVTNNFVTVSRNTLSRVREHYARVWIAKKRSIRMRQKNQTLYHLCITLRKRDCRW